MAAEDEPALQEAADAEMAATEPEPEPFKEEEDAAAIVGKKLAVGAAQFDMSDSTLNVMPTTNHKMLTCLSEGGLQFLLASVRCKVGVKSGRYMFEAKMVECLTPYETPTATGKTGPLPKQLVRVGLSLGQSSVILGDTEDSVCFDSEGNFAHGKKKSPACQPFFVGETVAVLVNLDAKSPHANTVSLFVDGERAGEPQPLPENFKGKVLYPTITYRNATLRVNFGPSPLAALPFTCHMIEEGAAADLEVTKDADTKGKYEVVFPVGLPDKGVFDWADTFLEKHPSFTELSDRSILEWARKSGMVKIKKTNNDEPVFSFGLHEMDNQSIKRAIEFVSPMFKRNYLIMQLRSNLVSEERAAVMRRFAAPHFKKVVCVMVGQPGAEHIASVQKQMLADKELAASAGAKKKKAEAERNRLMEVRRKKAEEAKRQREAAQKKRAKEAGGEAVENDGADDKKEEEAKPEAEAKDDDAPVELTEEEKKVWHRKQEISDLSQDMLAASFGKFSMPTKADGFDEVRFEWDKEASATKLFTEYVMELKRTTKVHDLPKTEWFKENWTKWKKEFQTWKAKQQEWKKKNPGSEAAEVDEDLDVMAVENIDDIGNEEPLYVHFAFEDWVLLAARYELHLLVHSYRKALEDPDRPTFAEKVLNFYYQMHFGRHFTPSMFSCEDLQDLCEKFVDQTIKVAENGHVEACFPDSTEQHYFVKLTEDYRRERERRVDAGDETAKISFPKARPAVSQAPGKRPPVPTGASDPAKRARR